MKIARVAAICLVLSLTFSLSAVAQENISYTNTELRTVLNVYTALAEEHVEGVLSGLKLLSATDEVRGGRWDDMKGLLTEFGRIEVNHAAVWYARPDGSYFTVEKGLIDKRLTDRPYFPRLMAGDDVVGYLIISKSTGKRSAVIAVPVKKDGKVVGAIGESLSLEDMSGMLEQRMGLPSGMIFYALDAKGRCSLHGKSDLLFTFPSDMGSETLKNAVGEMLAKTDGVVKYSFNGEKTVVFKRSRLTGWTFAIGAVNP